MGRKKVHQTGLTKDGCDAIFKNAQRFIVVSNHSLSVGRILLPMKHNITNHAVEYTSNNVKKYYQKLVQFPVDKSILKRSKPSMVSSVQK
jgi:hypothetical protein